MQEPLQLKPRLCKKKTRKRKRRVIKRTLICDKLFKFKMAKPFSLIYYYLPEDKDDLTTPNAFAISKAMNEVTLQDVEK